MRDSGPRTTCPRYPAIAEDGLYNVIGAFGFYRLLTVFAPVSDE